MKTVLVTGASGGIGYELAKLFAQDGYGLVLVARRSEKLLAVAGELEKAFQAKVKVIVKDLAQPSAAPEIFSQLQRESVHVDILVNNAGAGTLGFFSESDTQSQLDTIELNVVALTHLTRLFLPDMIKNKFGKILNVASTAAFEPGPLMATYYATKAFVLSFSQALANELEGSGVTVTTFCPGPTRTGFQESAHIKYSKLIESRMMDAPTVARIGYRGLMKNKRIVVPGLMNKIIAHGVRFLPRNLVLRIARSIQESRP